MVRKDTTKTGPIDILLIYPRAPRGQGPQRLGVGAGVVTVEAQMEVVWKNREPD